MMMKKQLRVEKRLRRRLLQTMETRQPVTVMQKTMALRMYGSLL